MERRAARALCRHSMARAMEVPGVLWLLEAMESGIRMEGGLCQGPGAPAIVKGNSCGE